MMFNDRNTTRDSARHSEQRNLQKRLEQPLLMFYSHNFTHNKTFTTNNTELPTGVSYGMNNTKYAQQMSTVASNAFGNMSMLGQVNKPQLVNDTHNSLKTVVFGQGAHHIQVRVNNLEDKFDLNATSYVFDVSAFAVEYFLEANNDLLAKMD